MHGMYFCTLYYIKAEEVFVSQIFLADESLYNVLKDSISVRDDRSMPE